jgi:ATP-dependent DNA helicase RecG
LKKKSIKVLVSTSDKIVAKLEKCLETGEYEPLETQGFELKPCPPSGVEWKQVKRSVNAFLNTRGGVLILGVAEREDQSKALGKKYELTGYREEVESQVKEIPKAFTDRERHRIDLGRYFPPPEIRDLKDGRVCLVFVDELPADEKYCFYEGDAFKRVLTGDHRLSEEEIEAQEEYKQEAYLHRELAPVGGTSLNDVDLEKLNEYIQLLNQQVKITTLKPDLQAAILFLESQQMLVDGKLTLLGVLVCGKDPGARIGARCRVQAYLDLEGAVAGDKLVMEDNVVRLIEATYAFVVRNTRKSVVIEKGGTSVPEYPEALVRESVNNAFAHRDYSINQYVSLVVKPDKNFEIRNPGTFRKNLLIQDVTSDIPIFRVVPEPKARNPKLAHVLNVFNKWEGRGLGMSTLTNMALEDSIDIPYFRFRTEEVSLFLQPGVLLDKRLERRLAAFNGYIRGKLNGSDLTIEQKRILAYLIKSEEINRRLDFTILLTQDNNHFNELHRLRQASLITPHPSGPELRPVFVADRVLMTTDFAPELRKIFGAAFDTLDALSKRVLSVIWRYNKFSADRLPSARIVALTLWEEEEREQQDIRAFDTFNRSVRQRVVKLETEGLLAQPEKRQYEINTRPPASLLH